MWFCLCIKFVWFCIRADQIHKYFALFFEQHISLLPTTSRTFSEVPPEQVFYIYNSVIFPVVKQ